MGYSGKQWCVAILFLLALIAVIAWASIFLAKRVNRPEDETYGYDYGYGYGTITTEIAVTENPKELIPEARGFGLNLGKNLTEKSTTVTHAGIKTLEKSKFGSPASRNGTYAMAAVAANGANCANAGRMMLEMGGHAVDAAIATLLCEGVHLPYAAGLGGGFLMTIWDNEKKKADFLDASPIPSAAIFESLKRATAKERTDIGRFSICIPGELAGYREAHRKYGRLDWLDLFEPTILALEKGIPVRRGLAGAIQRHVVELGKISSLNILPLVNNPATARLYQEGEVMKLNQTEMLVKSLVMLSKDPQAVEFSKALREGTNITNSELKAYRARWSKPAEANLGQGLLVLTAPAPASGPVLLFTLGVLWNWIDRSMTPAIRWHRIIEVFKHAFAIRAYLTDSGPFDTGSKTQLSNASKKMDELLSEKKLKETRRNISDYMTWQDAMHYQDSKQGRGPNEEIGNRGSSSVHVSVVDPQGNAVSATSTINSPWGSRIRSKGTGVIFNNQMDLYMNSHAGNISYLPNSFPIIENESTADDRHYLVHKRPVTSLCPTIVLNEIGEARLVVGAGGGPRAVTTVAIVLLLNLLLGIDIKESVDAHRLHHQLIPMVLYHEEGFPPELLKEIQKIGSTEYQRHRIEKATQYGYQQENNAVTAIQVKMTKGEEKELTPVYDWRLGGSTDGLDDMPHHHLHGETTTTTYES